MDGEPEIVREGPMHRVVSRRYSLDTPENWAKLREAIDALVDPDGILDAIEAELRDLIESEGCLRELTEEDHARLRRQMTDGSRPSGHTLHAVGTGQIAEFPRAPSYRVERAVGLLLKIYELRRLVGAIHPKEVDLAMVMMFELGLAVSLIRMLQFEETVARGKVTLRAAANGGRARADMIAKRNARVVAMCDAKRREQPGATIAEITRVVGIEFQRAPGTVEQIWRRAIQESGKQIP